MEKWKTYLIEGNPDKIGEILHDLEYYGKLHPLIQRVERVDTSEERIQYRITERPFRWMPIIIQYLVFVNAGI